MSNLRHLNANYHYREGYLVIDRGSDGEYFGLLFPSQVGTFPFTVEGENPNAEYGLIATGNGWLAGGFTPGTTGSVRVQSFSGTTATGTFDVTMGRLIGNGAGTKRATGSFSVRFDCVEQAAASIRSCGPS